MRVGWHFSKGKILFKHTPLTAGENELKGAVYVPDSTLFLSIEIFNNQDPENGVEAYGYPVYHQGKLVKGTRFAEGYFWALISPVKELEKGINRMEEDFALYPDIEDANRHYYVNALNRVPQRQQDALTIAQEGYNKILTSGERDFQAFHYSLLLAKSNRQKSDSLMKVVTDRYPKGSLAWNLRYLWLELYLDDEPGKSFGLYDSLRADFPVISPGREKRMTEFLLSYYIRIADYDNFEKTIASFAREDRSFLTQLVIGQNYAEMAKKIVQSKAGISLAGNFIEKSLKAHRLYDSLSGYYGKALVTYAAILSEEGKPKEALQYQLKAKNIVDYRSPEFTKTLIQYYINNGQYKNALLEAEYFISTRSYHPVDSLHKVAFKALYGTEEGYTSAYAQIRQRADKEYAESLKKKLTDLPAPDFVLTDLEGKKIKLSDLKGNIVVLDFWATWCGPCIQAFPSMKKLTDEFKNQPVHFLFINTMESQEASERIEKIHKTLVSRKTPELHVLLDQLENDKFVAAGAYTISSLPAKVIIDAEGKIRYRGTGFSSEATLLREIKEVMELIK